MGPLVAVTCSLDRGLKIRAGADYAYVRREYAARLREVGAQPVLVTPDLDAAACAHRFDALVVTGGDDLPMRIRDGSLDWDSDAVREDAERIRWERALLDRFSLANRPVLGVCYGMQLMNVHWGGSLDWCDVSAHGGQGAVTEHEVTLTESWPGVGAVGDRLAVNSSHRQRIEQLADAVRVVARSDDGTIEAIRRGSCVGVQWHPETHASGAAVYSAFASMVDARS